MAVADPVRQADSTPKGRARKSLVARIDRTWALPVITGLIAFVLIMVALGERGETVAVAMAREDVAAGSRVDPSSLRIGKVPKGEVADRLLSIDAATNDELVALVPIRAGDPIRQADVMGAAAYKGLRTMAISVAPENAAGGELVPGDRVDVIDVVDGQSAWVATGLEVIAVSRRGAGFGADLSRKDFLLVRVDADQALSVAAAMADGKIEVVRATGAPEVRPSRSAPDGAGA